MSTNFSRLTAAARTLALFALVAILAVGGCSSSESAPAPPPERVRTVADPLVRPFAVGSLIIPMDTTFQNNGTLKAFGLVYRLLTSNVPVAWAIETGKAQGGVDFIASARNVQTSVVTTSRGYRGGPFVIEAANRAAALPIIRAWQGAFTTTVHEATVAFNADVRRTMVAAPRIAVFIDGNEHIAFKYLNAASIPDSRGAVWPTGSLSDYTGHPDILSDLQVAGATTGGAFDGVLLNGDGTPAWCQLTSMHYAGPGNAEVIREVRGWLSASPNSHAFMECEAIDTFENSPNGHFLTTQGFAGRGRRPDPIQNLHPDSTFAQYDGKFTTVGGSVDVMNLAPGSTLYASDVTLINQLSSPSNAEMAWITGNIDGNTARGKVSYLTGHEYATTLPISSNASTNGVRLFLDSLFETGCALQTGQPTIAITLSAPSSVTGTTITYTISFGNSGPGIANDVKIVAPLPTGTTFQSASTGGVSVAGSVTWTVGNLAVNETGSVSFTVAVAQDGTYPEQAKLTYVVGVTPKEKASNRTTTTRTTGAASSDLAVAVTGAPNPVAPGGIITYSVGVTNTGPSASGVVSVTDTIPSGSLFSSASGAGWACTAAAGVVTCTHAAIPANRSAPLTIGITVPTNAGTVSNTIAVSSPTADPVPANNTVTTTTTVQPRSDLSVAMTASPSPVAAGAPLTYAVAIANAGPSVSGIVTYTDTLPAGVTFVSATGSGWACTAAGQTLTCTRAGLASGAQAPLSIRVTAPAATGTITNTGTVASPTNDPAAANNTASATTTVGPASADVSVAMTSSPNPAVSGGLISYSVAVSNAGPSPSGVVTVTDVLPIGTTFQAATGTGWTCTQALGTVTCMHGAIASGGSAPLTISVTAPPTAAVVTNTVTVSGGAGDPAIANNTLTTTTTVSPPPGADLSVTVTGAPDPVGVGGNVAYSVSASNAGPAASGPITLTDTIPLGATFSAATGAGWTCTAAGRVVTCTHVALASGTAATLTIQVTAPSVPGIMTNLVAVASTSPDPSGSNNIATETTTVTGGASGNADLSMTVTDTPDPVVAGGTATYQVIVSNAGPNASGPLLFTDTLPSGATLQSAAGAGWTCTQSGRIVTCMHAAIGAAGSAPLTITITAPQVSGTISNTATVSSTTLDANDNNNSVTTPTTVNGAVGSDAGVDGGGGGSNLSVSISVNPNPVAPAGTATYTITATNSGPDASGPVTVTETLQAGATFRASSGAGWTCTQAGSTVTCTHAALADNESSQLQIQVQVPSTPGAITSTTTVGSTTIDPDASDNTLMTTVTVAVGSDAGTCNDDSDCGGADSAIVCDRSIGSCVPGCRGQGGNDCPTGMTCTSGDNVIGQCLAGDGGVSDAGIDAGDGGGGDGGGGDGGSDGGITDGRITDGESGAGDGGGVGRDAGGTSGGKEGGPDGAAVGDGGGLAAPSDAFFEGGGCSCSVASESAGGAASGWGTAFAALSLLVMRRRPRRGSERPSA